MNNNNIALLLTFLLGIFILIGIVSAFFFKKKQKVLDFIFAFALSLLSMLIITHMLNEAIEHLGISHLYLFVLFSLLGILIFKVIDNFIPDHDHDNKKLTKHEERENIEHIGLLTTIALIIHNIIEGMAIYLAAVSDINLGIMMSLGVGLHNIPLGIFVTTTLYQSEAKTNKYIICLGSLFISSFIGGLIPHLLKLSAVSDVVIGSFLSITLGMLIYIIIFELLPKVIKSDNKRETILGIISGILIILLDIFI